jgi:nucleoside-diphosphate-sugar epimerase
MEDAPLRRTASAYGNQKLEQELLVRSYVRRKGLPAVILRPPNVYGPYSWFSLNVVRRLGDGTLPLVDDGSNPCNLVGVDNLVSAILASLARPEAIGETFFITDAEHLSWLECLQDYANLVGVELQRIPATDLEPVNPERVILDSVRSLFRVLPSGELRAVLRGIPLFRIAEAAVYERFLAWPKERQIWLRNALAGTAGPTPIDSLRRPGLSEGLIAAQTRRVRHSSDKARKLLGYVSPVPYSQGLKLTADWLRFARAIPDQPHDSESSATARHALAGHPDA